MHKEHAIEYKDLCPETLEYVAKKANKLGMKGRQVFGMTIERENTTNHVFLLCDPPKEWGPPNCL